MPELPAVGDDFAGYRMLGILGRGRTSVVYEAANPRLGNKIALKILTPDLAADEVFRSRFFEESRIAAALNHPNVVPIHDMGTSDDLLYIAMRRVSGTDLRQILSAQARLEPAHAVALLTQAARALDAAHRHGLVHRDVKPGNLLIEPGGDGPGGQDADHLYLTDFGITKVTSSRTGLTSPGEFVGTIDYIAPEQVRGISVMGMADQYSLGCVLYECLTGQVPFRKDMDAAVIFAHVEEEPPVPTSVNTDLPPAIDDVIARALAKQPGDRYGSCREFMEAAARALSQAGLPGESSTTQTPPLLRPGGPASGMAPVPLATPALEHAHGSTYGGTPGDLEEMRARLEEQQGVRENNERIDSGPAGRAPSRATGGRRWLAGTAAVLVLAVAGGATWFLTRGGSGSPESATTIKPAAMEPGSSASMSPGMSMSPGASMSPGTSGSAQSPLMTAVAQANTITHKVPPSTCHQQGKTQVNCESPVPGVAEAAFRTYPSLNALYTAYKQLIKTANRGVLDQNTQDCGLAAPPEYGGEVAWNHQFKHPRTFTIASMEAGKVDYGEAAGRVFCIANRSSGMTEFIWTQDDTRMLAWVAGPLHEQVWNWWLNVHHELAIGKPAMSMMPSMGS